MPLFLLMLSGAAQAADPADTGRVPSARADAAILFNIPAQPLQSALDAFGAASGFSGLYSASSMQGHVSSPVQGRYSADAALRMLIGNSGLAVRYTAPDAFILEPAGADPSAPQALAGTAYFGLVQARVRDAFCSDRRLAQGDYRLAMSFRIDAQGQVVEPALLSSTGDGLRDRAVMDLLRTIRIGSGPADPVQPFTMLVLPGTLRTACAA